MSCCLLSHISSNKNSVCNVLGYSCNYYLLSPCLPSRHCLYLSRLFSTLSLFFISTFHFSSLFFNASSKSCRIDINNSSTLHNCNFSRNFQLVHDGFVSALGMHSRIGFDFSELPFALQFRFPADLAQCTLHSPLLLLFLFPFPSLYSLVL